MSQPDLDLMAQEAEKYQDEEEADKAKFEARNGLVNHRFISRIPLTEDFSRRVVGAGREELETAGRFALDWLDENQLAEKVEFESHI